MQPKLFGEPIIFDMPQFSTVQAVYDSLWAQIRTDRLKRTIGRRKMREDTDAIYLKRSAELNVASRK